MSCQPARPLEQGCRGVPGTGGPGSCPHHGYVLWRALLTTTFSLPPTEVPAPLRVTRKRQGYGLDHRQGRTEAKGFTAD